ncbi:P-loop containing nucleoside triphosphate hydrolase, Protein Cms1 [Artemisia annua]|uniref:P-loop containing nucleoside triphosphate hydrolase, Protein Cms1 n=1 Tax=Artemisia annua TaxID=35608 RepID=A0A2U1KXM8_ARTAN|nr:P-loop containing nucleoside triphosphate hydrolase, Protein Cms1 [Artemisia annua]
MAKPQKKHSKSKGGPNHGRKHNNNLKPKKSKVKKKTKPQSHLPPPPPLPAAPEFLTTPSQQLEFFIKEYESANGIQLSELELENFKDTCILKLSDSIPQDMDNLSEHMKASFGSSWKEALCKKGENSEPGSPTLLTISLSALRSLELLRICFAKSFGSHGALALVKGFKLLQVSCLRNHVNVACGTPSRIKKLIDMEALGLSRLSIVVLDMYTDVKGYSLFSIPQIRDEFWELYTTHFHQRLLDGSLRVCLYGPVDANKFKRKKAKIDANE